MNMKTANDYLKDAMEAVEACMTALVECDESCFQTTKEKHLRTAKEALQQAYDHLAGLEAELG